VNKVLYWLSARPLFALIGKGYGILRKALDNIPGFDRFSNLATQVTDVIFGVIKFPRAVEERFEPYVEFQRGRQMDRALVFAVLIYMALLGAYPSNLGHLDTAPQIWIALPIVSGFNPYLGLVSGLVFSLADWIGKFLPFESVFGADFGDGMQNFWGARIGYLLAYTTLIINGMLPGILARVFRQFIRGVAHKILPRKATQAAMGLLMLLAAGALLYQVGGPRAVYAMSALSLMGLAMAMGPPPPGSQGSPCLQCGAMLPPGQYQCGACGGLSQEGKQYMDGKHQMEEEAQRRAYLEQQAQRQQQQQWEEQQRAQQTQPGQQPGAGQMPPGAGQMPPGAGHVPPGGGPMPPAPGMPPVGAGPADGADYLYEALATVGSMLGATVGIVASYEWAQQVGNYGAFYALRAEPDVSCRDLSAGNYGDLQAQSPIPGAAAGVMPPGAAGAVTPGGVPDPGVMPDPNPPPPGTSRWTLDENKNEVPQIYDPSVGGWRTAQHGDLDRDGQVYDTNFPGGPAFVGAGLSAAEAATRASQQSWQQQQRHNLETGNTAHDRSLRAMQERHKQTREMHRRRVEGNYGFKKFKYESDQSSLRREAAMHNRAADRWDRRLKQAQVVKAGADIAMNALGSIPGPPAALSKAYTVASSSASGAAEAHVRGDSVVWGATKGAGQGAVIVVVQDAIGGAIGGAGKGMASGKGVMGKIGGAFKGGASGAGKGAADSLRSVRTGYNAVKSGIQAGTSTVRTGLQTAGKGLAKGTSAAGRGARGAMQQGAHGGSASAMGQAFKTGASRGGAGQAGTQVGKGLSKMGQGARETIQGAVQGAKQAMGKTGTTSGGDVVRAVFGGDRASAITSGNPLSTPDIATQDVAEGIQAISEDLGMG